MRCDTFTNIQCDTEPGCVCTSDEKCEFVCTQQARCTNNIFHCKDGQDCTLKCNQQSSTCTNIKIYGNNAKSLTVTSDSSGASKLTQSSMIFCPFEGNCLVTCSGTNDCDDIIINATESTSITYNSNALNAGTNAEIHCPNYPGPYTQGSQPCKVFGTSWNSNLDNVKIYAVEGFYDVDVNCYANTAICWMNTFNAHTHIYCWDGDCDVSQASPYNACVSGNVCQSKFHSDNPSNIPTINPTMNTVCLILYILCLIYVNNVF